MLEIKPCARINKISKGGLKMSLILQASDPRAGSSRAEGP